MEDQASKDGWRSRTEAPGERGGTVATDCYLCGRWFGRQIPTSGDAPCPHCGTPLWIRPAMVDTARIVGFTPARRLDSDEMDAIEEQLMDLLVRAGRGCPPWIVLDLEETGYWTTSERCFRFFRLLRRRAEARGGRVILCRLRPEILSSYQSLRYDRELEIREDVQSALDAL